MALGSVLDSPKIIERGRSGDGFGWHEHVHDVHDGCERFIRPGCSASLIPEWLPALHGVVDKLPRGAFVADVGCGHGSSTFLMARSFPDSSFVGWNYHGGSSEIARRRAKEAVVGDGKAPGPDSGASRQHGRDGGKRRARPCRLSA